MKIYLVRHGMSEANERGIFANTGKGFGLISEGHKQAEDVANYLAHAELEHPRIYSSPLLRAVETAEYIAAVLDTPVFINDALVEGHMGVLEGTNAPEGWQEHNKVHDDWFAHGDWESVPGEHGETIAEIRERFAGFWDTLRWNDRSHDVILVSHGTLYRCALPGNVLNLSFEAISTGPIDHGLVGIVERRGIDFFAIEWAGQPF